MNELVFCLSFNGQDALFTSLVHELIKLNTKLNMVVFFIYIAPMCNIYIPVQKNKQKSDLPTLFSLACNRKRSYIFVGLREIIRKKTNKDGTLVCRRIDTVTKVAYLLIVK